MIVLLAEKTDSLKNQNLKWIQVKTNEMRQKWEKR